MFQMRTLAFILIFLPSTVFAKTVVLWQAGFPTIASEPLDQATLSKALDGLNPVFVDIDALNNPTTLSDVDLLVLPYGSAAPVDAWKSIQRYLDQGGNLLIIGGQPLHEPVSKSETGYSIGRPQDSYGRILGLRHTYEVPVPQDSVFVWKQGYENGSPLQVIGKKFFAVEGRLNGLGYMKDSTGLLVAAPVIVVDHNAGTSMFGGRFVALDFDPSPGYWSTADGIALIHRAATYASQGATSLSVETLFSVLRPGEAPELTLHLRSPHASKEQGAQVKVELLSGTTVLDTATIPITSAESADVSIPFHKPLAKGFYQIVAKYTQHSELRELYRNGLWVSEPQALQTGARLGVHDDFIIKDKTTFFPVGTNYFTTEENGWDFSGPRNAAVWEKDFSEMESHGVSFVRTGVWMPNARFVESDFGANERFLRNLEAFLLSAQHHHIAVNFTFFAFSPRSGNTRTTPDTVTPPNPYLDAEVVRAEQVYIRSVVERFKDVPWLCWDLINEPSFSNPRHIFSGNYPNDDPAEVNEWHTWLQKRYVTLAALSDAWSTTPEQLGSFNSVPLPSIADLRYTRYGNMMQVRAVDYNLFAQDMFSRWVKSMVETIRATGSTQLVDVGQDEGGVTDRVLNQFYGAAGLSFTTNHTYWQDDALLWDSVAAKRPGMPNITGETGYQPVWEPDGTWRYDELTGLGLTERKWVLGFAAGSSGAMQWDWAREVDFGMQRSDGSAKIWENMMRDLGHFAQQAAPYATSFVPPQVAIILPQSLQMSVFNEYALEAQQNSVRALYQYARGEAYAVGEYQIALLGNPKLIVLPSPMGLTDEAWHAIEQRVRSGATLLVTGPFDGDAHLHPTGRQAQVGLSYSSEPLSLRGMDMAWPGGDDLFVFAGKKTTTLTTAELADGKQWKEVPLGAGRILFAALPLEMSDNLQALGRVYSYAMHKAGVVTSFTTTQNDPGVLICPTTYPGATLYVVTSETSKQKVVIHDRRSNKDFSTLLDAGRAATLLVGTDGQILASYHWNH